MDQRRADPDELLKRVQEEEAREKRGKLKVFLGAAPGVGKTYTMLEAARQELEAGTDVVIGILETHGRAETAELMAGLEAVPRRDVSYRGRTLPEFDLDAALARHPALILVDELAHTNAPGSRHLKRWQDVKELLDGGIDVWTTMNVQHLESLNDAVAQITGVRVRETLPDDVIEQADEVELVDLPPDELLERLREGKVYPPEAARRAEQGFFRKGNLLALRELALRRTAERVDAAVLAHRRESGIGEAWPVGEHVLVCVGDAGGAALVRTARRMAARLRASWTALYVERPGRGSEEERTEVTKVLRLAEQLGAEVVTLSGDRIADEVLAYARRRNITRIVVGKPARPRWKERVFGSFVGEVIRSSGDIDVLVVAGEAAEEAAPAIRHVETSVAGREYLRATAAVGVASLVAGAMFRHFEMANLVMVYLLGIVWVARVHSRGASLYASALSVAAFDFLFVPPHFTFAVSDVGYVVTFVVMFIVAAVISSQTVRVRQQAEAARLREERARALYWLTRELARRSRTEDIVAAAVRSIADVFEGKAVILLPTPNGVLRPVPAPYAYELDETELGAARWTLEHKEPAGLGTATLPGARALYLPLTTTSETIGIVGLCPADPRKVESPEQRQLLATFCKQTAVALERTQLAQEAHDAERRVEREELRSSLLSSVSHDLRTPLAAITGAATTLLEEEAEPATRRDLLETIAEEAGRLNRLVRNLLDMTRLESGGLVVSKEWTPLEEIVGAALDRSDAQLRGRPVKIVLPEDLPLVPVDGVLLEQAFLNLIENAAKYTPPGTPVEVAARAEPGQVVVEVSDRGPGLPEGGEEKVFEKFYRGQPRGGPGGTGLGLAIARGIVAAHGGTLTASGRSGGGAAFRMTIPVVGTPPALPKETEAEPGT